MKYKIGEAAQTVGVSVRSLRHLDSLGVLKPSFRDSNGNRYYSNEDIDKLSYINLLQLAGFTLREIPTLLSKTDVRDEFAIHYQMLQNKGKYYQFLGESLAEICENLTLQNAPGLLEEFRNKLNAMSERFHSDQALEPSTDDETHGELIVTLRKLADMNADHIRAYKQIIKSVPQLLNESFFESFLLMIRMHKSNAFKLGELDLLEKNFNKVKKQLESDIV